MKVCKAIIGVIAGFTLISNACAANKTHLTDALGAGNNKVDISFGVSSGSATSTGSTTSYDSKMTGHSLYVDYARGITDRLDITISAPLIQNSTSTSEYVFGGNQYKITSKTDGQGDLALRAQYLILDKQQNQVDWIVLGLYSPSTASSEDSTSEVSINGSVFTPGKTGKPGRGYATTGIATALAIPSSVGDVILTASYTGGGETTSGGVKYRAGDSKVLGLYLESMISESTTLTPFVGYHMFGSYSYGTQDYPSTNAYSLGIGLTHDVSKSFSIKVDTAYMMMPETSYTDNSTYSYKSYSLFLSTLFFF